MVGLFRFDHASERRVNRVLAVVAAAPDFLRYFEPRLPVGEGLYMFWDLVLSEREDSPKPLQEAVFKALERQISFPEPRLRESALHGFGHLKDPRSQSLIKHFIDQCPPGDLRTYAETALRFEVL